MSENTIMPRIAIVILNWNGSKMMQKFLPSVIAHADGGEVIVADNGSSDDSLDMLARDFSTVKTLPLGENYGFAEGYNRALAQLEGQYDYYILLNSDVETPEGWLLPLCTYMENHAEVAACAPKLLQFVSFEESASSATHSFEYAGAAGGFIDALGYPYCRGRIMGSVEKDNGQYDDVIPVMWASGACLMIRANDWHKVGGLDARFFAHQEEIDLCWRLKARGREVVCIPQSHVFHVGGGTLPQGNPRKTYLNFRNNLLLLYKNIADDARLARVMRMRILLDNVAALKELLTGNIADFRAIHRARKDFKQMRSDFADDRARNCALTTHDCTLSPKSILCHYYFKGHKSYNQL